jgi:hypothetical protein
MTVRLITIIKGKGHRFNIHFDCLGQKICELHRRSTRREGGKDGVVSIRMVDSA